MNRLLLLILFIVWSLSSIAAEPADSLVQAKTLDYNQSPSYSTSKQLAIAFAKSNNHLKALEYFVESSKHAVGAIEESNAFNNIGASLHHLGRYSESISHHRKALELRRNDVRLFAQSCRNISMPFAASGKVDSALFYIDASSVAEGEGENTGYHIANHKGVVFHNTGNFELAKDWYLTALPLSGFDNTEQLRTVRNIINTSLDIGDRDEVEYWLDYSQTLHDSLMSVSSIYGQVSANKEIRLKNQLLEAQLASSVRSRWILIALTFSIILLLLWLSREIANKRIKNLLRTFGVIVYNAKKTDHSAMARHLRQIGDDVVAAKLMTSDNPKAQQVLLNVSDKILDLAHLYSRKNLEINGGFVYSIQDLCNKLKRHYKVPHLFQAYDQSPKDPTFLLDLIEGVFFHLPYDKGVSKVELFISSGNENVLDFEVTSEAPEEITISDHITALVTLKKGRISVISAPVTQIKIEL